MFLPQEEFFKNIIHWTQHTHNFDPVDITFNGYMKKVFDIELENPKFIYFDIKDLRKLNEEKGHTYVDSLISTIDEIVKNYASVFTKIAFDDYLIIIEDSTDEYLIDSLMNLLDKENLKGCFVVFEIQPHSAIDFEAIDRIAYIAKSNRFRHNVAKITFDNF